MRLAPRSLKGRLTLAALGLTLAALIVAGGAIGFVLHRFVTHQLEERLDQQIETVREALERGPDGRLTLSRNADGPPFDRPRSGWYWRASGDGVELRSASLETNRIELDGPPDGPPNERRGKRRPRSDEARGPGGAPLFVRVATTEIGGAPVEIAAAAPVAALAGPMREAMTPLVVSLALLGLGLGLASVWQVRLGLKPLGALQSALGEVRAGRANRVPDDQPNELKPLARELNALIGQNEAQLANARLHVANLAHGLKTPLATLGVALQEPGRDPDGTLGLEIDRIERRIRHHLARGRAAALGSGGRVRTVVAPRIGDLATALTRIHAARGVAFRNEVAPDVAAACDQQDLDEMAGNLLDNAFKWAAGEIVVRASGQDGRVLRIAVEDDGAGLSGPDAVEALKPGRRLDEATPGHGFGLSIARELAELYGGALALGPRSDGKPGLAATLTLPAA